MIKLSNLIKEQDITPMQKDKPRKKSSNIVIFVGGIDSTVSPEYKSLNEQTAILKSGMPSKTIISFGYVTPTDCIPTIKQNPNASVILFSAACKSSATIASAMIDKTKLYILEPYAISSKTSTSVASAVSLGVPAKNVLVGSSRGRGKDIVPGATKTPDNGRTTMERHWNSLVFIGSFIK